jgi:hypothetical protein
MEKKNRIISGTYLLFCLALMSCGAAQAADWSGFYDKKTLTYWGEQMPPGINENLREVVWPKLTQEEKKKLAGVVLSFPLEDSQHPMNFYAPVDEQRKAVVMPISSLRFYGDLAMAYAWLNTNNYSLDSVTDYLAMLKYQWPGKLMTKPYRPMEVLGIPASAREDPQVMSVFQRAFGTCVVFIMAHELGHLYYQHPPYESVGLEVARSNEEQADQFALEIMRRIGDAPLGMPLFFTILAHLESYSGDPNHLANRARSTHPVTAGRIRAIARALERNSEDYSRTGANPVKKSLEIKNVATQLDVIAINLEDKGVQELLRQKGLSAQPEMLGPRRPGEHSSTAAGKSAGSHVLFNGAYQGDWLNEKGTSFPGELILKRQGENVTGTYSFGAGSVTLKGVIDGERLYYNWKWGTEYFGKGVLQAATPAGEELSGTWGYTKADQGAGTWKLRRDGH